MIGIVYKVLDKKTQAGLPMTATKSAISFVYPLYYLGGDSMEKSFSQRMGFKPTKDIIQLNSMDDDLKVSLWNCWYMNIYLVLVRTDRNLYKTFISDIWIYLLKFTIDTAPLDSYPSILEGIKERFFSDFEWYEVYDLIQFSADVFPLPEKAQYFIQSCNEILSRELSGYRFVENKLVPITSELEIAEIETAWNVSMRYTQHLDKALAILADRKSPDYANSIKESILAVEATCRLITGDPTVTLGDALNRLISKRGILHTDNLKNNLKEAFKNLYWYTSDAQGIRHGLIGQSDLDIEDARFMLISCSAFINYLIAKADKAGVPLLQVPEGIPMD